MNRYLIVALSSLFLLLPALCMAGALAHPCADCPSGEVCGHEESCAADPCGRSLLPPAAQQGETRVSAAPVLVFPPAVLSEITVPSRLFEAVFDARVGIPNLSTHQSDLPLLN